MRINFLRTAIIVSLIVLTVPAAQGQVPSLEKSVESVVTEVMTSWRLPGVVVVVVKDGKTLVNRGFGTRVVGQDLPVGPATLVQIASHTKAVTATALAMLVDAGKLSWDDPVKSHLPEFSVDDPTVTGQVTVRDLVAHRGGLPAPAIGGFQNASFGMEDLFSALRTRRPRPLRDRQVYSQAGIALAGQIVARVSGMP